MPIDYHTDRRYSHLTPEQVRKHYEAEKELRDYLLNAPPRKRGEVFLWAYDELFRRIPWHPALTEQSGTDAPELIKSRVKKISRFLPENTESVLEIGCGMGELLIGLSGEGYRCTGVDISEVRIARLKELEGPNLNFHRIEGTRLPFEKNLFSVVISIQLFEHLHPDDASAHLTEVFRVLKPGGRYLLETPNHLVGPGDVSRFFVDEPEGFHLKEYKIRDLVNLLKMVGYRRIKVATWYKRVLPEHRATQLEFLWSLFPKSFRRRHTLGLHNPLYIAEK